MINQFIIFVSKNITAYNIIENLINTIYKFFGISEK